MPKLESREVPSQATLGPALYLPAAQPAVGHVAPAPQPMNVEQLVAPAPQPTVRAQPQSFRVYQAHYKGVVSSPLGSRKVSGQAKIAINNNGRVTVLKPYGGQVAGVPGARVVFTAQHVTASAAWGTWTVQGNSSYRGSGNWGAYRLGPRLGPGEPIARVRYMEGTTITVFGKQGGKLTIDWDRLPKDDGASVPSWLGLGTHYKKWLDSTFPEVWRVHDYLYSRQGIQKYGLTRLQADQIMKKMMVARGYPNNAKIVYRAVRIGGQSHFGTT